MKILISKKINIDSFYKKNPIEILESSDNGAVAVSQKNTILFYIISPSFLKKIFDIEYPLECENLKNEKIKKKFSMYSQWKPDSDFLYQSSLWGIILNEPVKKHELASFISYWKEETCFFYHVQWQQKLARYLEKSRHFSFSFYKKRDITYIPEPDQKIPEGFRGK